jgi:hypothetical protein
MRHIPFARWPKIALLAIMLAVSSGCGGQAQATTPASTTRSRTTHAPLEAVAHHHRCPSNDARAEASPDLRTANVLVPAHPAGALICRYWGLNDPGHHDASLAGTLSIHNATVIDHLAARLDALPPFPRTLVSCPTFGGRSDVIFFHYRDDSDDPVRIKRDGCVPVSNGRLLRSGLSLPYGHWPDDGLL